MLARMAVRLGLGGVVFRPAYFHTAYAARHEFAFVDPERQGRFEALVRDLAHRAAARGDERASPRGACGWTASPTPGRRTRWPTGCASRPPSAGEVERERERVRFIARRRPAGADARPTRPDAARHSASSLRHLVLELAAPPPRRSPRWTDRTTPARSTTSGRRQAGDREARGEPLARRDPTGPGTRPGCRRGTPRPGRRSSSKATAVHREPARRRAARASRSRTGSCSRQGSHQLAQKSMTRTLPAASASRTSRPARSCARRARRPVDRRAAAGRRGSGGAGARGGEERERERSAAHRLMIIGARRRAAAFTRVRHPAWLRATENLVPGTEVSGSQMISDKIGSLACAIVRATRGRRPAPSPSLAATHPPRGELLMRNITPVIALGLALLAGPRGPGGHGRRLLRPRSSPSVSRRAAALRGQTPELVTVAPLFEILNISARDVTNPIANDLQLVVSTWGSYELADPRWDNGTSSDLTGDVVTGVPVRPPPRRRAHAAARPRARDDRRRADDPARRRRGDRHAAVRRPRSPATRGVPVSQRFSSRSGVRSWNPVAGDLAYGGRAACFYAIPGVLGARPRRRRLGELRRGRRRPRPPGGRARTSASSRSRRTSPCSASARSASTTSASPRGTWRVSWTAAPRLHVTADWRYTAPDLFLARNSILSVFSAEDRNDVGGGVRYELSRETRRRRRLPPRRSSRASDGDYFGHLAEAGVEWEPRRRPRAGGEVFFLDSLENGYVGGRALRAAGLRPVLRDGGRARARLPRGR